MNSPRAPQKMQCSAAGFSHICPSLPLADGSSSPIANATPKIRSTLAWRELSAARSVPEHANSSSSSPSPSITRSPEVAVRG
ncbi:hypothetical protein EYF80_065876 [Liparis tanakae]|uniref:Uncharacterized protein n=1 Tax=Liparis tanakae TaxID=230148 RepID=A0A4Z2E5F2_9TELE|nr:hypothetical protein EYF80_065876 [Liparis tanakae]